MSLKIKRSRGYFKEGGGVSRKPPPSRIAALLYFSPAGYFRGARRGRHGKNWFLPPDLLSRAAKSGTQVMAFPSRPLKIFSKTTKDRR